MTATVVGPGGSVEIGNEEGDPISVIQVSQLVPKEYDDVELGYGGTDITSVIYRNAGSVVATLTLTYDGDLLTRIVRT
jgi:hypothetical protein